MYKILPILLFAFLIAEENRVEILITGSDVAGIEEEEFLLFSSQMEYYFSIEFDKFLSEIIDKDKYYLSIVYEAHAMVWSDETNLDSIPAINLLKSWNPKNLLTSRIRVGKGGSFFSAGSHFLGELRIIIFIDNSITLDDSNKTLIRQEINSGILEDLIDYPECITYESVNIKDFISERNNNTMSLHRDDIYDDSWAVIIGIDKYENLSNLDYAVADAEAVKDMLINKFDYKEENVRLLLNEDANRTNIVKVISDVSLKASENDRILVFYAGHGETMPLPDGGEMGYLVPIDGNQDNLLASAIPMDDLKRFSNVSKAKHMLFLVDACYGGLAAVGSRGLEPAKTPNYIEKISNIKSRQIITAGGKDEKVFEKSEWGHSAYTKNLLSALGDGLADANEDGYITADELGDYLSEKVTIDSENQQTPQSRRLTSHEGEFIFF